MAVTTRSASGARPASSRRAVVVVAAVCLVAAVTIALLELIARVYGYQPRRAAVRPEPGIHAPDPVLGWRPIPGEYRFGPYSPGGATAQVTILPDTSRRTGPDAAPGRPLVVLVGCSFTFGWAVSDDETWARRPQELRPDVQVVNHGVGGYGTFQSLLVLEQLLGRDGERPARVLYGFIDHSWRNVAAPIWLRMLSYTEQTVATPYCTLTPDGHLERHPPAASPSLPLHDRLASVAALENAWLWRQAGPRQPMAQRVTELLLNEMVRLCQAHGLGFSMVLLSVPDRLAATYVAYGRAHGIDVIDCNQQPGADDIVPGEAHPNGRLHRRWGECIGAALAEPKRLPPP